jgi:hypothetical protein
LILVEVLKDDVAITALVQEVLTVHSHQGLSIDVLKLQSWVQGTQGGVGFEPTKENLHMFCSPLGRTWRESIPFTLQLPRNTFLLIISSALVTTWSTSVSHCKEKAANALQL